MALINNGFSFNKKTLYYFVVLLLIIPLIPSRFTKDLSFQVGQHNLGLLYLTVLLVIFIYLSPKIFTFKWSKELCVWVLFIIWAIITSFLGIQKTEIYCLIDAFYWWPVFLLPIGLKFILQNKLSVHDKYKILKLIILISAVLGIYLLLLPIFDSLIIEFLQWEIDNVGRPFTPLGPNIATGAFLLLTMPVSLVFALNSYKKANWVVFGCIVVGIIATLSRFIIITAIIQLLLVLLYFLSKQKGKSFIKVATIALIIIFTGLLFLHQGEISYDRLFEIGTGSDELRYDSKVAALNYITNNPGIGSGPGLLYPRNTSLTPSAISVSGSDGNLIYIENKISLFEPHDMYLMVAVEYGLIGLFLFLTLFGFIISNMIKKAKHHNTYISFGLIGLIGFLLQALGSTHLLKFINVSVYFWIFLGALEGLIYFRDINK